MQKRSSRTSKYALAAALGAGFALIRPQPVLARAGGGGGFHNPSGGGGDGDSGGSGVDAGDVEMLIDFLMLTFRHPAVGVPLDIVIVAVLIYGYRQANARGGNTVWRQTPDLHDYRPPRRRELARDGLTALKANDPAFDEGRFAQRVGQAFVAVQTEWTARKLDRVKALTTDGIRERFQLLLDLEKVRGIANVTKDIRVAGVRLVDVQSDQLYDTVQVCIDASAVDYHVKAGTDDLVAGSRTAEQFSEYWSFLRRRGKPTGTGPGLMEGHCPSCGAGLTLTDRGECGYCKAIVNTGAFDWVLAEITQASVADGKGRQIAGLAELSAKDPAFNVQYVEDRVSVMFWRLRLAEANGSGKPLVQIATPAFLKGQRGTLEARDQAGRHKFTCDAAVGAIDLVAAEPGQEGQAPARLHVRVKWSGREVTAKLPALIPPDFDSCHLYDEEYVLVRDAAAKTPAGQELRSGRCQACGAPQTADAGANCASCGAALNTGELDWLLEDVHAFTGITLRAAQKLEAAPGTDRRVRVPDTDHLIGACVMALTAGGPLGDEEKRLLVAFARQREVGNEQLAQIARSAIAGKLPEAQLKTGAQRRAFLMYIVKSVEAEGALTPEEEALILRVGQRLNVAGYDLAGELARVKQTLAAG